jgi:DNA recombination protein RmuC
MAILMDILAFVFGFILAWSIVKATLSKQIATLQANFDNQSRQIAEVIDERNTLRAQVEQLREVNTALTGKNNNLEAKYEESLHAIDEQKKFIAEAQRALKDSFDALSAAALDKNNHSFLDLAKTALETHVTEAKGDLDKRQQAIDNLVKPLGESLTKMDEKINSLETKREGAYFQMSTLLDQMKISTTALDKETKNLVTALKTSHTRGRYGEIALRRLVEFAGMLDQCDFEEQVSTEGEAGKLRPDMIIHLPGNRSVVVDSKVPLSAYLQIFETEDHEQQKIFLNQHISAVRSHIKQLSAKAYWDQFPEAPDFVVLFMQIESSFGAALQGWPGLIEEALNNRIIVATPTTLITILRSIGYSWNQLKTVESIEAIRDAAVELYERSAILMDHMVNIGKGLTGTINHYNKAVGSLEGNFLPQGRKIQQLSQAYIKKQLTEVVPIEASIRPVIAIPPSNENETGHPL